MPVDEIIKRGRLFVLSAPSGSGKSTIKDIVMERMPELIYSVSYTTRPPRPGEVDGRDYNFVTVDDFKAMIEDGRFLEWAEVFGRYYGTGRDWVDSHLAAGQNVIADLDVVGAASVRRLMPEAVLIFMVPPTAAELRRRLVDRHTETDEEIARRLNEAKTEVDSRGIFDYLLINGDIEKTAQELIAVINGDPGWSMTETETFWPDFFADR